MQWGKLGDDGRKRVCTRLDAGSDGDGGGRFACGKSGRLALAFTMYHMRRTSSDSRQSSPGDLSAAPARHEGVPPVPSSAPTEPQPGATPVPIPTPSPDPARNKDTETSTRCPPDKRRPSPCHAYDILPAHRCIGGLAPMADLADLAWNSRSRETEEIFHVAPGPFRQEPSASPGRPSRPPSRPPRPRHPPAAPARLFLGSCRTVSWSEEPLHARASGHGRGYHRLLGRVISPRPTLSTSGYGIPARWQAGLAVWSCCSWSGAGGGRGGR